LNGPYHPIHTLPEIDQKILRLKKRLQTNKMKQQDPEWQKRRNAKERERRRKLRETNPEWWENEKRKTRERYRKNPKPQIESTIKWNKANRDRKNATNRRSYEKNKEKISARNKLKRKLKREAKQ